MKNQEEEITTFEKTFDELAAKLSGFSGDDPDSFSDEKAYASAADRVRTIALEAAGEYRKRGKSPPPHVESAMFFMPAERGSEPLIVDSTSDDRGVESRLDNTDEPASRRGSQDMDNFPHELSTVRKQWTLMFFFASDNVLSPSMLTQIKAIKAAGYQQDTNVLVHFDPNEGDARTRTFEINRCDSANHRPSTIGDCSSPLVSVLTDDDITPKDLRRDEIDALGAPAALEKFLTRCREDYPADHYMLFMVGHGTAVGRDAFLPDENPSSAIGLADLGVILSGFSKAIKKDRGVLELIGMQSCSMSSVEVAYELMGTANYMLASQGISFIGAWPYRKLLTTIYKAIDDESDGSQPLSVHKLVEEMYDLCIQHSADFMVGGYSADLCLSTLKPDIVQRLDEPMKNLGLALKDGLEDARCRELILLAHWKSQSYWQETYTDLYDFCLCLRRLCVNQEPKHHLQDTHPPDKVRAYDAKQKAIESACLAVMNILAPSKPGHATGPIIRTDFIGACSQYSHGLSIYFPWSEPVEDKQERALTNYKKYDFATAPTVAWLEFLESYLETTKRPSRLREDREFLDQDVSYQNDPKFQRALVAARKVFSIAGKQPDNPQSVPLPQDQLDQKISPPDAVGGWIFPAIKNYSREFSMSPGVASVFDESKSLRKENRCA